MQQEEEWKNDVEATLAMKEARAQMLQMEKEEMIQEVSLLKKNFFEYMYICRMEVIFVYFNKRFD